MFRADAARRAAETRLRNDARRDQKKRKATDEVDSERDARGKPTLSQKRLGAQPFAQARKTATHEDEGMRAWTNLKDRTWNCCLRVNDAEPPRTGQSVKLFETETGDSKTYHILEVVKVSKRIYTVFLM